MTPKFSGEQEGSKFRFDKRPVLRSEKLVANRVKAKKKPVRRCLLANDNDFLLKIFGYALGNHFD